jgi:hypothetical protein
MTSSFANMGGPPAQPGNAAALPRPGAGVLLTVNPTMGFSFNARSKGQSFPHNFRPLLSAAGLRISYGTVSAREPMIGQVRMSQATLKLSASTANGDGESWAAVEVEVPDGIITSTSRVEVVHTKDPNFFTPTVAREPLVLIVWRKRVPVRIEPIRQWSCTHHRIKESATFYRHVFL